MPASHVIHAYGAASLTGRCHLTGHVVLMRTYSLVDLPRTALLPGAVMLTAAQAYSHTQQPNYWQDLFEGRHGQAST